MSRSLSEREREKLTGEIAVLQSLDVKELKAITNSNHIRLVEFLVERSYSSAIHCPAG